LREKTSNKGGGNGRRPQTNRIAARHPYAGDALGLAIGDCGRDDHRREQIEAPLKAKHHPLQELELSPIFGDGLKDQAAAVWV
jgi:hypothetical protein